MCLLRRDVFADPPGLRRADGERAVAVLPREAARVGKEFVKPTGCVRLQVAQYVGDRLVGGELDEGVDVIRRPVYGESNAPLLSDCAADVVVKSRLVLGRNQRLPV